MTGKSYEVVLAGETNAAHEQLRELFESRYVVRAAETLSAVRESCSSADCIVVIEDDWIKPIIDAVTSHNTAVISVLEATDKAVIEACSQAPDAEILFVDHAAGDSSHQSNSREHTTPTGDDPALSPETLNRIETRVDEHYRRSVSELSEAILAASRSLMGAAIDEVDTKIMWELRSVGQQLAADRCAFYRYDEEHDRLDCTHEWDESDSDPEQTVRASSFPGFDTLKQFDPAAFPPVEDSTTSRDSSEGTSGDDIEVPDDFVGDVDLLTGGSDADTAAVEPARPAYLDARGFEAFVAVPVVIDWSLYGILAVGSQSPREWTDELCRQLRTFGEHVGYTLRRRQRRQALEAQNERLERFAAVISHDLQNPISVITGYTELAIETDDTEPLEDVMEAATRMERLVDDLLTLAREGNTIGETTEVTLSYIVDAAWGAVDAPAATLTVADNGDPFEADPSRLQQAFENLFKNAVEHGGDDVTITVERTPDGFAVADDGPGIPEERREQVFEEGVTGGDGTGLGLAIVSAVVDGHGWTIDVTESSDGGAQFDVTVS